MRNSNQYGGPWPDNELSRMLPIPGFEVHSVTTDSHSCNITFKNTSVDQLREYVESLKKAGFDIKAFTRDGQTAGKKSYLYTAKNSEGYEIIVSKASFHSILSIKKP